MVVMRNSKAVAKLPTPATPAISQLISVGTAGTWFAWTPPGGSDHCASYVALQSHYLHGR
jgi:hypothetical protein